MHFRRLTTATDPAFADLVRIYANSFPASERKPIPILEQMLARPEYLFLAAEDNATLFGFSISIAFPASDAALGEYMAVDPASRTHGIGPKLLRATMTQPGLADRFILIEIDAESRDRERLKHFYRRFGCRQVEDLIYRMPRVSTAEPPLMDLLLYRRNLPGAIEKSRLQQWLIDCYRHVYGVPKTDPRIAAMLQGLPETIRLI